jgi:exodeoxyribonuclease VII small subunit
MPLSPNPDAGAGASEAPAESRSFEAAYHELQQVVAQLEDGGLDLERAILLFERGSQLVQICERIVDQAELRVTRLAAETASPLADASVES